MASNKSSAIHQESRGQIAILPLLIGIALTLLLSVYPIILTNTAGKADHNAAYFAFWAMSAGYIRGVGFIPLNRPARYLFSTAACLFSLLIAAGLISTHWV